MMNVKQQIQFPLAPECTPASHRFMVAQFVLRGLVVVSTVIAIAVMASSEESISILGIEFVARYNGSSAFKFLMGVDVVVGALALFSMIGVYFAFRKPSNFVHLYYMFLHDLILMVLTISACGAATAIGYVALNGQQQTLWLKVCDRVGNFCLKNGISVAFSYAAFLCLFALTIMSSYKLYNKS
ncbi:CASP-like protein 1F2 [Chenopodium quinoa]|uniref:CASP-like protein 1F2 n=1 Tax=Chenopodium quinoa TaxID=63459 RepID=UPI000B78CAC2|nr:CASP-like protein 1F2 [Chenopodium quinoa]